jgi:hypothetical protein
MNMEKGKRKTGFYIDGQDRQDKNRTIRRIFLFNPAHPVYPCLIFYGFLGVPL